MFGRLPPTLVLLVFAVIANADQQSLHDPSRGELLYSTHCIACHNTEVHWRNKRLVTDSASLISEIRRWQSMAGLGWSDEDIAEVAQYLNATQYRYRTPD